MTPADLTRTVVRAVRRAVEDGELPAGTVVPERVVVERTRPGGVGEYATPVAFQLAKAAGARPLDVARLLAGRLERVSGIRRVEITGAGFLNFAMDGRGAAELVGDIRARGPRYGYAADAVGVEPFCWGRGVEIRMRTVYEATVRLVRSQGDGAGPGPLAVAPVARRDGDVVARYGADAAAWAMLTVPARETPHFPAGLLVQDESSEFFRVRYAHARAAALLRNADELGFTPLAAESAELAELAELGDGDDGPLPRALGEYPLVLEAAAHHRAPERLTRHLVAVADALLDFQYHVLPKGDEKPSAAHRARLALAEAAGTVLAGGLALLGVDAPDFL